MKRRLSLFALVLVLSACHSARVEREPDEATEVDPLLSQSGVAHVVVTEAFVTASTENDNIDSPAAWRAPDGKTWLFATAKEGPGLTLYDGDTGETWRSYGAEGDGPGQFRRVNGISIVDDLLFVVERDNHRVQVLTLPSLAPISAFGAKDLTQPYGLWVRKRDGQVYEVLVTDAYMAGKRANGWDIPPPLSQLDRRVHRYRFERHRGGAKIEHLGAFGDVTEAGAIRIPESIQGDVAHDRLLISEEDTMTGTAVREYNLAGQYRGRTIGLGLFKAQAEGIALWQCADGSGYWITTDQYKDRSLFHLFDRVTLEHIGAFAGDTVANTDGIWLHQSATTRFPNGVFYAVHDDQGVGAFDWRDIAKALNLRADCTAK